MGLGRSVRKGNRFRVCGGGRIELLTGLKVREKRLSDILVSWSGPDAKALG